MAYRKKISVNMWSPSSIENAIKELEKEKAELEKKRTAFLEDLSKRMEEYLLNWYNLKPVWVNADFDNNSIMIMAEGEGLLFIEFGTGLPADSSEGVRFGYGAGSWSRDHAGTYDAWLASGRPLEDYPYNHQGLDAFMALETKLRTLIKESMNEVFK